MSISANFPNLKPSFLADFANSQVLDSRITFSRSTTAPYYDGKTSVLAEQNLVVYSQLIGGTGWTYAGANLTVATNATTAPDGTTTASTLTATGTSAQHATNLVTNTPTSPNYQTLSVYAQAGTNNFVQLCYGVDANAYANFNLSTGAVGTVGSTATATITQVGSTTWYRCTVTTQSATAQGFFLLICTSATATRYESNTLTTSINLWGAQLEQRSSTTAYNATTTTAITNYIPQLLTAPINAPRFDFNPTTGESLGLLIEQSSTNLQLYSQSFDNAYWNKTNATITTTANIAPDGTQTMQLYVPNNGATIGSGTNLYKSVTLAAGSIAISVYAKAKELTTFTLQDGSGNGGNFNLSAVTATNVGTAVATITSVGNGVYRCVATIASAGANPYWFFYPSAGTANGYNGIYIWGAQLEALAFPTSYIPTTSAQVTRASDNASMTGTNFSSWFNIAEGTIYSETSAYVLNGTNWCISDGTSSNRILSGFDATYNLFVSANGTTQAQITVGSFTANTFGKVAGVYKTNDFAVSLNSSTVGTDTLGIIPSVNQLQIGGGAGNASNSILNGRLKKFAYYPIRVTNAQLQALTGT